MIVAGTVSISLGMVSVFLILTQHIDVDSTWNH